MWNRKEIKRKGKAAFKSNWIICIIVAFILSLVVGESFNFNFNINLNSEESSYSEAISDNIDEDDWFYDEDGDSWYYDGDEDLEDLFDEDEEDWTEEELTIPVNNNSYNQAKKFLKSIFGNSFLIGTFGVAGVIISILLTIFLLNLFEIGGDAFFIQNSRGISDLNNLLLSFNSAYYKNHVYIQLIKDIKLFLWSLLLIVPGIIKAYEYSMIPYLLAEHPEMSKDEVFAESKRITDGHKWDLFILDLSFIGWRLLSGITFGILNILWTNPYSEASKAEAYLSLK